MRFVYVKNRFLIAGIAGPGMSVGAFIRGFRESRSEKDERREKKGGIKKQDSDSFKL